VLAVQLSESFDLVIPPELREPMGLRPGQRFAVISKGRSITLVPVPELSELEGMAEGASAANCRDRRDRT